MKENSKGKEMPAAYDPTGVEEKWYAFWEKSGYFNADPSKEKKPFSIVIPPPNVTGSLHIGHALNNSLQDFIIRRKRMQGYEALWLPGTDHAGIATQNVVERKLAEEGIQKEDLGREEFLKRVWEWKEQYGGRIILQLKKLGCSCDWRRTRFTMDEGLSRAVREVFVRLYEEGLVYRDYYIVNWCPRCNTALSDIEVEHCEIEGKLWYIKYPIKGSEDFIQVATTRPETMLGDTAVAVNPADERYAAFIGQTAVLPLMEREIAIIADEAVDMEFGTGAVKVTPAHDPNDFEIGRRHELEEINIFNPEAVINSKGGEYRGLDRYAARAKIVKDLEKLGLITKVEVQAHAVGHCYRCNTVVEPYLSLQWFVKMKDLAGPAIEAVRNGHTVFIPRRWEKTYFDWMYGIKDWCVSRQLWWGHRIPAWYCKGCGGINVSREDIQKCGQCGSTDIEQDPDVLDTWFSSALWPFSTMGWPDETEDLEFFYPTSVLVTAFDIIFFWVARMMFQGIHFMNEVPFKEVFMTPLVRDAEGKKMSKSSGNVIDPLDVLESHGTDALRFTLAFITVPGRDIFLSSDRIEGFRHFCNKIWNASRFAIMSNHEERHSEEYAVSKTLNVEDRWILSKLNRTVKKVDSCFDEYNFSEAAKTIYNFFWNEFCDWYIEMIKSRLYGEDESIKKSVSSVLMHVLNVSIRLLHPFMPFITEEIWSNIPNTEDSCMIASWPCADEDAYDKEAEAEMEIVTDLISSIRKVRSELKIHPSKRLKVNLVCPLKETETIANRHSASILALCGVSSYEFGEVPDDVGGYARAVFKGGEAFIPIREAVDVAGEIGRLSREINKNSKEAEKRERKLQDSRFLEKAPEDIVKKERQKLLEARRRLEKLEEQLRILQKGKTEGFVEQ